MQHIFEPSSNSSVTDCGGLNKYIFALEGCPPITSLCSLFLRPPFPLGSNFSRGDPWNFARRTTDVRGENDWNCQGCCSIEDIRLCFGSQVVPRAPKAFWGICARNTARTSRPDIAPAATVFSMPGLTPPILPIHACPQVSFHRASTSFYIRKCMPSHATFHAR